MSNPNNPSDFAQVRLTLAGVAFAGDTQTLRLGNAHSDYTFVGQISQKVVRRGELPMFLAYTLPDGRPMFECAPDAVQAAAQPDAAQAIAQAAVQTAAQPTATTPDAPTEVTAHAE